ncbi:MAG: phage minor capsid protein [Anaerostipes faecalis]|nr:phage minor capsid protein [Anaerostipes faecalis]
MDGDLMDEYDITQAIKRIEDELIASMIRNMQRHKVKEVEEKKEWSMWQAEQLKALDDYKKRNQKKYGIEFSKINEKIPYLIAEARRQGNLDQEIKLLETIGKRNRRKRGAGDIEGTFFKMNDRKINVLIDATVSDIGKAETAILRRSNDAYRKIIYNAQVYAASGAGTYAKAVDMATKDFLSAGIQCVQYKNGAMHTLSDYVDMAIRTASKRAYLTGEGEKRQEWGIHTVIINKRGNPCPKCLPFVGKILIDDVWSGGEPTDGPYPLMSTAVEAGLYHPRCRDSHTTYFPGISTPPDDKYSKKEIKKIQDDYRKEQKEQYAKRQEEKFERLAEHSLDLENVEVYKSKENMWKNVRFNTGGLSPKEYADSKRPLANFRAVPQDKVVNILRRDSEEWIAKLTDEEKRAIRKYTYNSGDERPNRFFERLNAMLRGDQPENEKMRDYAEKISAAIKKNKLNKDIIAYRGVEIDPTLGAETGKIIIPGQFFSTSVISSRSFSGYQLVIYVKKGSKAAYIEKLSSFPGQRELLIDKDCFYRVISRKGNIIELEVL